MADSVPTGSHRGPQNIRNETETKPENIGSSWYRPRVCKWSYGPTPLKKVNIELKKAQYYSFARRH